jgi:ubiquinone biosynthesis protein
VVREWIERHLGPAGKIEDLAEGAGEVGKFLGRVPALMSRGAAMVEQLDTMTRDGLVLSPETVEAIGAAESRRNRWIVVVLWVIAALLAWGVWKMI